MLATDGQVVEAEELATDEPLACLYAELANHSASSCLAGISTVAEIKDNLIDIKATGRLNKLYVELLKDNEDWATDAKRPALNQLMVRLISCYFAEDTGIFLGEGLFSTCLRQMTDPQSTNTHEVIEELFRAMDTPPAKRKEAGIRSWADGVPLLNELPVICGLLRSLTTATQPRRSEGESVTDIPVRMRQTCTRTGKRENGSELVCQSDTTSSVSVPLSHYARPLIGFS